ncbi:15-hydroxyprostaglandin dehydrogenase [NAD(+)]-like [Aphomia sociella]
MARDLNNKLAVITGGAQGLGYAIAEAFLRKGARIVILLDMDENTGAAAADALNSEHGENKAVYIKCDITTDLDAVSKTIFDKYKTVDVLVNNAGVVCEDDPKKCMAVNAVAIIEWTKKFWEHMRKDKGGIGGTIVNMSSIYGFRIDPFIAVYKASKFAVLGFTRTFGHQYHYNKYSVRIVAICPGYTYTGLGGVTSQSEEEDRDFKEFISGEAWQYPDAVGQAAVEIFQGADSGTVWLIEGNQPIKKIEH